MALLAVPQPYDFERSLDRFTFWGVDRANVWHDGALHRVIGGREVRIEAADGGVRVEPFDEAIEQAVRKLLGLELELEPFYEFAATDVVLANAVLQLRGFRPPLAADPFEALVSSITAQQVSLHAAFAVRSRFIERFGEPAEIAVAFPTRDRVAQASEDELRALGFSTRKAEYVLGLARAELDFGALASLPDEEVKLRLTALRGLGAGGRGTGSGGRWPRSRDRRRRPRRWRPEEGRRHGLLRPARGAGPGNRESAARRADRARARGRSRPCQPRGAVAER